MKLKWIKRMSVGAAIAVLTAFFVVGCGSTEKQNNGSLSTDSSQDISEVSTKQEVLEKSEVPKKSADELKREKVEQYLADMTTEEKVAQLLSLRRKPLPMYRQSRLLEMRPERHWKSIRLAAWYI